MTKQRPPYEPHPARYLKSRRYVRPALEVFKVETGERIPTLESYGHVIGCMIEFYNEDLMELPRHERPSTANGMVNESELLMQFGSFWSHGRKLFRFSDEKVRVLRDLGGILGRFSRDTLPAPALHLSFGPQAELDLWNSESFVDGAYIKQLAHDAPLEIILTSFSPSYDYSSTLNMIKNPERVFSVTLPLNIHDRIEDAINQAEEERRNSFESLSHQGHSFAASFISGTPGAIEPSADTTFARQESWRIGFSLFRQAAPLLFNALSLLKNSGKNPATQGGRERKKR